MKNLFVLLSISAFQASIVPPSSVPSKPSQNETPNERTESKIEVISNPVPRPVFKPEPTNDYELNFSNHDDVQVLAQMKHSKERTVDDIIR